MKRKGTNTEYLPIQFLKNMIEEPDAPYFADVADCDKHYAELTDISRYGAKDSQRLHFSRTAFVASDWAKCKQAYKITPELAADLLGMDDLSFPAGKIRMPFRTVYFDLSDLHITSTGEGLPNAAHAFIEGIFLTYGKVPFDGEDTGFAGFVVLTGVPETKELLFGGVSFAVDDSDDSQTLNDLIEANAGMPEIKHALRIALLLAAYISSEKPDITENEAQKTFYRPSRKLKTSAVRKWDVGVRYATEVRRRLLQESDPSQSHGTSKSPRPHIRKAHWHIYRIGSGRKETKVLWLAPIEVNCRSEKNKTETPAVVRVLKG